MRWSQPLRYANTSTTETSSPNNASSSTVIATPTIKNHSVTYYNNYLYCFGGYDGRRNHSSLLLFDVTSQTWSIPCNVAGTVPPGRNGHTSTLARDQIIILGGWLGSGPLAASDLHVLDVSEGPERLRWYQPRAQGTPPGPCNMHSADYIPHIHSIFVFRGGDGRQYLNDLHSLDCSSFTWKQIQSNGAIPQARANHCSAVLVETRELVIFGGWTGRERLNDVHILNVDTLTWTKPDISGELPHPRAGMTLTACRDRLFLFGGSGTSSKCFNDLQILDRKELRWLDVNICNEEYKSYNYTAPSSASSTSPGLFYDNAQHGELFHQQQGRFSRPLPNTLVSDDNQNNIDICNYPLHLANPNDEDSASSITIIGRGPGRRAGHSSTAVNRYIYVFGGSCGADYLSDFFVLDTDPPPTPLVNEPTSLQLLQNRLQHFFNEPEFSDVTFVVEGKRIYAHKLILCLVSDCFRAMFTTGFREATEKEIEIPNCSYGAFHAMMVYIYTSVVPTFQIVGNSISNTNNNIVAMGSNNPFASANSTDDDELHEAVTQLSSSSILEDGVSRAVEILELADQFFLDHLKQSCERMLQAAVRNETVESLLHVAQKTNSLQLEKCCRHFARNRMDDNALEDVMDEELPEAPGSNNPLDDEEGLDDITM
jgi:hypothetical protein